MGFGVPFIIMWELERSQCLYFVGSGSVELCVKDKEAQSPVMMAAHGRDLF